ncbi:sugar transferase [Candidatus Pelagibacter sp. HIMB1593]|uniref:sugar transferase n=1 Tax=Candidatus Pelagibacter sp. HIMB1593 TaxID=3413355 RepID=UPI003F825EAE
MIRFFDLILSILGIFFFIPIIPLVYFVARIDTGSGIFNQLRIGKNQKSFLIYKFRTMKINTPSKGTHLIKKKNITKFGNFLRSSKLDEILQLYNVLIGEMSLVGPRPCLLNQKKLIVERKKRGVFKVKPGITGLAQITGITMKTPILLAKTDSSMIKQMNLFNYFYYIIISILIVFRCKK